MYLCKYLEFLRNSKYLHSFSGWVLFWSKDFFVITANVSLLRSLSVVEGQLSILILCRHTRFLSLETFGQKTIFSFQEATASAGLSSVQLSMMLNFLLYLKVAAYPKVVVSFLLCIKIFLIKRILLCPRAGRAISKNESRRTDPTSLNFCSEKFQLQNLYFSRIRM